MIFLKNNHMIWYSCHIAHPYLTVPRALSLSVY